LRLGPGPHRERRLIQIPTVDAEEHDERRAIDPPGAAGGLRERHDVCRASPTVTGGAKSSRLRGSECDLDLGGPQETRARILVQDEAGTGWMTGEKGYSAP